MWWISSGIVYAPPPPGPSRGRRATGAARLPARRQRHAVAPRHPHRVVELAQSACACHLKNAVTLRRFTHLPRGERGRARGGATVTSAPPRRRLHPRGPWLPPAPCPPPRVRGVPRRVGQRGEILDVLAGMQHTCRAHAGACSRACTAVPRGAGEGYFLRLYLEPCGP